MGIANDGFNYHQKTLIGPKPVQIGQADFNKDGNLDLVILSVGATGTYGNSLYVLKGDGQGSFSTPFTEVLPTADYNARFAIGDFNGDSWLELALIEPGLSRLRVVLNDKETEEITFTAQDHPHTIDSDSLYLEAGDFTGDADCDLVVTYGSMETGTVKLLLSAGDGTFSDGTSVDLDFLPTCITVDMMDDNDSMDIAIGGGGFGVSGKAMLLPGDGSGNFGAPVINDTLIDAPYDLAVGDLDNDGLKDFVFALRSEFLLVSVMLTTVSVESNFVRGDANGDSSLDLSDAIKVLLYLFQDGKSDCLEAMDVNNDSGLNISDAIYLLTFLFVDGGTPAAPYPDPGIDPDPENSLGCDR